MHWMNLKTHEKWRKTYAKLAKVYVLTAELEDKLVYEDVFNQLK